MRALPEWAACSDKVDNDEPLNPVEQFVYDNEVPRPNDDAWRASLLKALEYWSAER